MQERGTEFPSEPPFIRNGRLCKEYSIDSVSRKPRRYFPARHQGPFPCQCNGNMPVCLASPPTRSQIPILSPIPTWWPPLLQSNSIQVGIHLMSIPVRNRFLVWLTGFRPPAGKRLRNLTVDCDGNVIADLTLNLASPPYIARTGRPRLVYMH